VQVCRLVLSLTRNASDTFQVRWTQQKQAFRNLSDWI
jgi:hypothetical protein